MNVRTESAAAEDDEDLYRKVVMLVRARPERICVANVQRTFAIGYNRAASLVERLVSEGVVERRDSGLGGFGYRLKEA